MSLERAELLQELKQKIGSIDGSTFLEREALSCSYLQRNFPKGKITELVGAGKTEAVCHFLKEHSNKKVLWVESNLNVYPIALFQRGVDLSNVVFVEATTDSAWVIEQALKSQIFSIFVLSEMLWNDLILRRFQLLAEKSKSVVLLLSSQSHKSWVICQNVRLGASR